LDAAERPRAATPGTGPGTISEDAEVRIRPGGPDPGAPTGLAEAPGTGIGTITGRASGVAPGGMFVDCPCPLPVGCRCRVAVTVRGVTAECEAWVVRSLSTGRTGMGLLFREPDTGFVRALAALAA